MDNTTVQSDEERSIAIALLLNGGDASVDIALPAVLHFIGLVKPQLQAQQVATAETMLRRFAGGASSGEDVKLAVKDFDAFCRILEPLVELSPPDMIHSYVTQTLTDIFRLLAESNHIDSPSVLGSSIRVSSPGDHHALDDGTAQIRKEDLREYLEHTTGSDGKPLLASHDVGQLLLSGRQNDIYFDDFVAVMYRVLHGRSFSRSSLVDSIEERRRTRREAKKKALEKIKAVMTHHQEPDKLGAELRAAASPPRRRALSPFAFGSWRASQGAAQSGATETSSLPAATSPSTTAVKVPGPLAATSVSSTGVTAQEYTPVQPVKSPRGSPSAQSSSAKPSSVSNLVPDDSRGPANPNAADASATAPNLNVSYDFSAHNAILDDTFSLLDVDQSGSLSLDAIYELCAAFPHPPQPNAIRRLFHLVDVNASNDIDREEFEQLCFLLQQKTSLTVTDMCSYYTTAMYRRLFELLDDEGDGNDSVSREELRVLLEAISPILQASFSSGDVYRLTREFETDQLNFLQFQLVVKQLIRGKSISKVVGAFEEVLRRRRLLKRQALERFAQAPVLPPRAGGTKKLPPPPSGAPPSKGASCAHCSTQARRILELEEQVNTLHEKLKAATEQCQHAVFERDVLQHSNVVNKQCRVPNVVQCFAALDGALRGYAPSSLSVGLLGGSQGDAVQSPPPHTVVATPSAMDPSLLGAVARAATDAQWQHIVSTTLGVNDTAASCPLSGDRTIWADSMFSAACRDVLQLQRDLNALVAFTMLPHQAAIADATRALLHHLQGIVSLTPEGEVASGEALDGLHDKVAAVAAAREKARQSISEHHHASSDAGQPSVMSPVAVLLKRRDALATIALAQVATTTSAHRALHTSHRGGVDAAVRTPRGHVDVASSASVTSSHSSGGTTSAAAQRLKAFYAASTAASQFLSLLQSEVSSPLHVETVAHRFIALAHLPIREEDFTLVSSIGQDVGVLEELLSVGVWDATYKRLSESLADVQEMVVAAVQTSKKDKAVMVNTIVPTVVDAGTSGGEHSPSVAGGQTTPRLRPPPSPHSASRRESSPFNVAVHKPSHATSTSTRARSPSLTKPPPHTGTQTTTERSPYQAEIANRSSSPRMRSRRERPVNVRHNLDRLLQEFLKTWHRRIPPNFDRADPTTNIFHFGEKKIELNAVDNFITVKVGGGYLLLEEYCEKYGAVEMRRWAGAQERSKSAERAALAQAVGGTVSGGLRLGRSPSPALQVSPRGYTPSSGLQRGITATPRSVRGA